MESGHVAVTRVHRMSAHNEPFGVVPSSSRRCPSQRKFRRILEDAVCPAAHTVSGPKLVQCGEQLHVVVDKICKQFYNNVRTLP